MTTNTCINRNSGTELRAHTYILPHAVFFLYLNIQTHHFVWHYPSSEAANSGSAQHRHKIKWPHEKSKSAGKISAANCYAPTSWRLKYKYVVFLSQSKYFASKICLLPKVWHVRGDGCRGIADLIPAFQFEDKRWISSQTENN